MPHIIDTYGQILSYCLIAVYNKYEVNSKMNSRQIDSISGNVTEKENYNRTDGFIYIYIYIYLSIYLSIYIYIYISEHKQNVQNDEKRAQPLNSFLETLLLAMNM